MPQSLIALLQKNQKVRQIFDTQPDSAKRAIMRSAWRTEVQSKLPQGLSPAELESAKETFVDRFLKTPSKGPLYQEPTPTAGEFAGPVGEATAPMMKSLFTGMATGAEVLRGGARAMGIKRPWTEPRSGFRDIAEAAKEVGAGFEERHPVVSFAEEMVPAVLVGRRVEQLVGPAMAAFGGAGKKAELARKAVTYGAGATPFAETVGDIPKEFALGATIGPMVEKLIGPAVRAGGRLIGRGRPPVGGAPAGAGAPPGGGPPASPLSGSSTYDIPTPNQFEAYKAQKAAEQLAAQAKKSEKTIQSFVERYGEPNPEQLALLKEGGQKARQAFREAAKVKKTAAPVERAAMQAVAKAEKNARARLVTQKVNQFRKDTGNITQDDARRFVDEVNKLSLDEVNGQLAAIKAMPKGRPKAQTPPPPPKATTVADVVRSEPERRRLNSLAREGFEQWALHKQGLSPEQLKLLPATKREHLTSLWRESEYKKIIDEVVSNQEALASVKNERPDVANAVESLAPVEPAVVNVGDFESADMMKEVAKLDVEHGGLTTTLLQRKLRVGYGRAVRMIDQYNKTGGVATPEVEKVILESKDFVMNVAGQPRTILSVDEAALPTNVDIAIKRLREAAVDEQGTLTPNAMLAKYGPAVKYLQQPGMETRLREDLAGALRDMPRSGRPTAGAKPKAVRAKETGLREKEAVSEAKLASMKEEQAAAQVAGRYSSKLDEFRTKYRREPSDAERLILSHDGSTVADSLDQEFQLDFENKHPDLFGD